MKSSDFVMPDVCASFGQKGRERETKWFAKRRAPGSLKTELRLESALPIGLATSDPLGSWFGSKKSYS